MELHNLYDITGNWNAAQPVVATLIEMNPKQPNYYFRMGRTYAFLYDYDTAKEFYKTGLKFRHGISIEKLIEKVQLGFTDNPNSVTSEYIFINGRNNLGAFIHNYKNKRFFTKISRATKGAKREVDFYKNICKTYPTIQQTAPIYIDSKIIDKIIYLTIEHIDDIPTVDNHLNDIMETSQKISSIPYNDIVNDYPNPNYLFQLRNRPVSVVTFFTQIHKKEYNQKLFSSLKKLMQQNNYSSSAKSLITDLESIVFDNHLYALIDPEKHYSLLHGDFIPDNVKIQKQGEVPQVFDWASFTIGPHFIDAARYLAITFIPYPQLKENYLLNKKTGGKLSKIEQIFFLYALIIFYFLAARRKKLTIRLSEYIEPAFKDMKQLVADLDNSILINRIAELSSQNDNTIVTITKLKQQNKRLRNRVKKNQKQNQQLQSRYQNILSSKSWKITAPLRKLIEVFNKK